MVAEHNFGDAVFVVAWLLFCCTTLVVGTRVATRLVLSRKVEKDDIAALVSLIFSAGHTGCIAELVTLGLGKPMSALTASDVDGFQKVIYAANFLFLATLWTSKVSVLFLVIQLTPDQTHKRMALGGIVGLTAWFLSSVFATAFQCDLPTPWAVFENHCFDLTAFWDYVLIFNIVSDVALVLLPVYIIWSVHIERRRKIAICSCFAARLLTIICSVAEVIYGQNSYISTEPAINLGPLLMCGLFTQNISLITACVPYLKPFYLGMGSGMIRSDDLRRQGLTGLYGYGTGKSEHNTTMPRYASSPAVDQKMNTSHSVQSNHFFNRLAHPAAVHHNTTIEADPNLEMGDWDKGSSGSHGSQSRIILQTTTWTVES